LGCACHAIFRRWRGNDDRMRTRAGEHVSEGVSGKKRGEFTDDDLMQINGNRDILAGKIQEKYGIAKEEADRQVDEWAAKLKM
jgi:uncharacterized protein YjbJ (UPF0337 family)